MNENIKEIPDTACLFACPVEFRASKTEDGTKFKLVPYKGQIFNHWFWGKLAFDISGLSVSKEVIPALLDHKPSKVVGAIEKSSFGKEIVFEGVFEDTPYAKEVLALKRVQWECSLALDPEKLVVEEVGPDAQVEVNGVKFMGPGHILRSSEIYECSFTLFGAVPGTSTHSFSKSSRNVPVTVFSKGVEVSNLNEPTPELDQEKLKAEGKQEALSNFQSMLDVCPDDPELVQTAFKANKNMTEFMTDVITKLRNERDQLKTELAETKDQTTTTTEPTSEGADPVNFASSDGKSGPKDFMEAAKAIAKAENVSMSVAFAKAADEHPELYSQHNPNALTR